MKPRALLVFCSFLDLSACAKKPKTSESPGYIPNKMSQDAIAVISHKPTRPDGGAVLGKSTGLDPEVSESRKLNNIVLPVVFGESVAGISMQTTNAEAKKILAPASLAAQGFEYYPEHIRIAWKGEATSTPDYVVVDEGYAGKLQLPAPYGASQVGQSLAPMLATQTDLKNLLLNAGALFEKQAPTYDCEKALTCQLTEDASYFSLEFRRGGLLIAKQTSLPLSFIYFNGPNKFYARAADPIVYQISVAGINFQSKRAAVEARLGPAQGSGGTVVYYDKQSVGVIWGADETPAVLQALGTYQGSLNFGLAMGSHRIGDSMASYVPLTDDGTLLMQMIYRGIKATDLDCTTLPTPCTLTLDLEKNRLTMNMDRSAFVFSNTAERKWLLYGSIEP